MVPAPDEQVTELLGALKRGEQGASQRLMEAVHTALREMASSAMRDQPASHTLQPTALVNEAYIRLVEKGQDFESRRHFFFAAARAMRDVLVEGARRKATAKRGGGWGQLDLDNLVNPAEAADHELAALGEALERLGQVDPRQLRLVELRFFAGMSMTQTAELLELPLRTAEREWTHARAWLYRDLERQAE